MIYNNILEAMGNTPLIRLSNMVGEDSAQILVKFEGMNVGGSIKTRTAFNMIQEAEKQGLIHQDTIIVEPTSGNQGIGLALVGAVRGYQTKIIMPDSVSEERRKLVQHYGAEVILIHDAGNIGACIEECLQTALRMKEEDPRVFVPQQFENPANPAIHRSQTAVEILQQVDGPIHGFCSGIGTGGTITGIGETLKAKNPEIEIWAVEPEHAAILSGGSIGTHIQMGIGDGVIPDILNQNIYDHVCIITDEEAINSSKALASKEGIMCGISSGTNVAAAIKLAKKLGPGKTVVTVLPDTAERYFSTPLFEQLSSPVGRIVTITVDRPLGSCHPKHPDICYPINYGYIEGILAPDGEEQDVYLLGVEEPVAQFTGKVIAVIHRNNDIEEKWVVCPEHMNFTKEEIWKQVEFQEQYFDSHVWM